MDGAFLSAIPCAFDEVFPGCPNWWRSLQLGCLWGHRCDVFFNNPWWDLYHFTSVNGDVILWISSLLLIHHAPCTVSKCYFKVFWAAPGVSDAVSAALQGIGLETIPMPKWWTWSNVLNCGPAHCLIIADKEWLIPGGLGYRHHPQADFFHVSIGFHFSRLSVA